MSRHIKRHIGQAMNIIVRAMSALSAVLAVFSAVMWLRGDFPLHIMFYPAVAWVYIRIAEWVDLRERERFKRRYK